MLKSVTRFLGFGSAICAKAMPESNSDPIIFVNDTEGWAGSGFERQVTEFQARRVWNGRDEVQISVEVRTYYKKTQRTTHGHLALNTIQLDALLSCLTVAPERK